MTHEYVIGLGGRILFAPDGAATSGTPRPGTSPAGRPASDVPTAIAWAADRVLAVGSDAAVRAISRGDSVFLDLAGCVVTPLPGEPAPTGRPAETSAIAAADAGGLAARLVEAGRVPADATLEPGAPAELAFWGPGRSGTAGRPGLRVVATVRGGAFSEGDQRRGPFPPPGRPR